MPPFTLGGLGEGVGVRYGQLTLILTLALALPLALALTLAAVHHELQVRELRSEREHLRVRLGLEIR